MIGWLLLLAMVEKSVSASTTQDVMLNLPGRHMWGWKYPLAGYCGETSFQTAGIYFGQWLSSEKVKKADGGSELLLGVNDKKAAKSLKFNYDAWNFKAKTPQPTDYVAWIREHIDHGHPVIVGLYVKEPDGDPDYDHIVPVVGYQFDTATLATTGIWYNDLYVATSRLLSVTTGVQSRSKCSQKFQPI